MIRQRAMSNGAFVSAIALVGLLLFCAPVTPMTPLVARAFFASAPIVMTGTSVIQHASKCDADTRSIAAMLAADRGIPVLDLSFTGQSFSASVNLAAVSLRNPHVRTVVLTISIFALMEANVISLRDYAAFRVLNPSLPAESLWRRVFEHADQSGLYGAMQAAFEYGGVSYPAYNKLKTRFLQPERDAMGCPETDGRNTAFISAMYGHTYLQFPILPANIALVRSLGEEARRRGKTVRAVVLPIDAAQMQALLPAEASRLGVVVRDLDRQLEAAGVAVTDVSAAVPNAGFADRWCACGHLMAEGRRAVAARVNSDLPAGLVASAAASD